MVIFSHGSIYALQCSFLLALNQFPSLLALTRIVLFLWSCTTSKPWLTPSPALLLSHQVRLTLPSGQVLPALCMKSHFFSWFEALKWVPAFCFRLLLHGSLLAVVAVFVLVEGKNSSAGRIPVQFPLRVPCKEKQWGGSICQLILVTLARVKLERSMDRKSS